MASSLLRQSCTSCINCTKSSMTFATHQSAPRYYILTSSCLCSRQNSRSAPLQCFQRPLFSPLQSRPFSSSLRDKIPLPPEAMNAIKQSVAQNMGVKGAHDLVPDEQRFSLEQTPDLSGKVAVITGNCRSTAFIQRLTWSRRLGGHWLRCRPYLSYPQHLQGFCHFGFQGGH